jgi:hypothetical protein
MAASHSVCCAGGLLLGWRAVMRAVHRVLAARCCKSAYRAQQASVTGLRVCLSACAADECGLRLLTAQSALAPAAAASASSASCAADCSAAAEAATSCAVSMHLAQTLLQHGRFVQLEVLAACASLSVASSAQHHVLGLQEQHTCLSQH